ALEGRLNRFVRLLQRLFDFGRQLGLQELIEHRFVTRTQRIERQLVPREEARRRAVEERVARARIDEGHRDAEVFVNLPKLTKIGKLARSRDVTDRRKE